MTTEDRLGVIYRELANELNISDTLYERALSAYNGLADYIKAHNDSWDVEVFPQGSFELGTVIRPVSEEDEYDVDMVVLIKVPDFTDPKELRDVVKCFLEEHGRYEGNIEEKKQCLRVVYSDSAQFHMDVVCAKPIIGDRIIDVAKKQERSTAYMYNESNPKGYISWFKETMNYSRILNEAQKRGGIFASTKVEELSLSRMRTPLQQAIQILKRHRDIYFADRLDDRPSSIVITTLCAKSYEYDKMYNWSHDNVYTVIKRMLELFPRFIETNENGEYVLKNPSLESENFLYKWKSNENLERNFREWIRKAKVDIVENPESFLPSNPEKAGELLRESFGSHAMGKALKRFGEHMGTMSANGEMLIDRRTRSISSNTTEAPTVQPKKNTFFGG